MKLTVGIDDSGFYPSFKYLKNKPFVDLIVVYFYKKRIVDVKTKKIKVDGLDATKKLLSILKSKKADLIFSPGITFGGFNLIDFTEIFNKTKIPSIIVIDKYPNFTEIKNALVKHFKDANIRLDIISKLPEVKKINDVYFECIGIEEEKAKKLIKEFRIFSKFPEPLRIANMIARAIFESNKF